MIGELTAVEPEMNSMDEQMLWYLSGAIDTAANIKVRVQQMDSMKINYLFEPQLSFSRPSNSTVIFGLIDEYSESAKFNYHVHENESSTRMIINSPNSIQNFLEPIIGGFIQQRERAEFFVEELLPLFDDGPPNDKESVLEIMERVETLREYPIQKGNSKYDYEYFEDNL